MPLRIAERGRLRPRDRIPPRPPVRGNLADAGRPPMQMQCHRIACRGSIDAVARTSIPSRPHESSELVAVISRAEAPAPSTQRPIGRPSLDNHSTSAGDR
ncbi:Hypothetical protein A7982_09441 [Minicystis rosea]|nr:Hypothetical protein A7982_09441 [Minicystis rosea]